MSEIDAEAVCGAYLAVAYADARYSPSEEARLLATLANEGVVSFLPTGALEGAFNRMNAAFRRDYAAAKEKALAAITSAAEREHARKAVISAARFAIVADRKILPQEEHVIREIGAAIGLAPGEL